MRKLISVLSAVMVAGLLGTSALADSDNSSNCVEVQYGIGRPVGGGTIELEVDVFNKCNRPVKFTANYAWEGADTEGNSCSGSIENEYLGVVYASMPQRTFHIMAGRCWQTKRAWIVSIISNFKQ
jgi:hypothetical protein